MNKSQRVILGVGLIVLAVVLHFVLCKWTDSPSVHADNYYLPTNKYGLPRLPTLGDLARQRACQTTSDVIQDDKVVFGWLCVRAGVSMLAGILLGIVTPIALLTTAAVAFTCSGGGKPEADSQKSQ